MKKLYLLIVIYLVALAIAIYGYITDTDPIIGSFANQVFEVIMLSVFIFGILMLPVYLFYFVFRFFKRIQKPDN
jgi:cytochrome bd-type quinol oxidase subunit 2